jgi:Skp family chaperone for outer membrane proteins
MAKAERFLLYLLTAAVVGLGIFSFLGTSGGSGNTAFVDIGKLLESYNYRKDLEQSGSKELFRVKGTVDSLRMLAKVGAAVQEQLAHAEAAFEQYYNYTNQEISKKIWERLNPMLEQYGKDHGLQLLIGANGAGTVLYGSPAADKTQDVLQYVNDRYAKGN